MISKWERALFVKIKLYTNTHFFLCIDNFQFDKLESCQNMTLAANFKVDLQNTTAPGKSSRSSNFVAVEYYWDDANLDGAPKTELASSSFEYYAPS